jgi:ubiquinone/menaquinone biosynthesis C-methylase UbiE
MPAPNIRDQPALYELENRALDPDGVVLAAMRALAPWSGLALVDLGCGSGFWLPGYAAEATTVIGVEPDPDLRTAASVRVAELANVTVLAGSAEHLPMPDASVDVVHARFAYFFGEGGDAGLREVRRVLTPAGTLVVVDNDYHRGDFAEILRSATQGNATIDPDARDRWWYDRGAQRVGVMSEWRFDNRADTEAVLRNEFRDAAANRWLDDHPDSTSLSYGYVLFVLTTQNVS